jgi:hypothetical protein
MSSTTTIDWKWADYQRDTRDALETRDDIDLVALRTGYGGGKSITGGQWIHRGALLDQHGDGKSLVMAQDYAKGKSTTYAVFFDTLPGDSTNPFDAGDPEHSPIVKVWHQNDKRLTYITGHSTFLGGADKWSRFAGAEFSRIWCDEVAHYPPQTDLYKLHEMLVTRQRTDIGPNTTLWTSTGNGFNQFYDITERHVDDDDEPLAWADRLTVFQASTEDNPFLPDEGLAKIQSQFTGTERESQGLHGSFAAAEGLVYDRFSRQTHVKDANWLEDHVDDDQPPIYGYDAGWDHPRVLVQYRPTHLDQWAATQLYYETGREFQHLCDPDDGTGWVYDEDLERGRLYGEHEPEHLQKFERAGFDAVKAEKSLDEGIPHVRGLLADDGEGRPGLVVADGLTELIQEFQSYKEQHVGSSGDVPDHVCDATRYALFTHANQDETNVRWWTPDGPSMGSFG